VNTERGENVRGIPSSSIMGESSLISGYKEGKGTEIFTCPGQAYYRRAVCFAAHHAVVLLARLSISSKKWSDRFTSSKDQSVQISGGAS